VHALREYLTLLECGQKPGRQEFLTRYPEIAVALAECLDGLEFVHAAAPQLHVSAGDGAGPLSASAAEFSSAVPLGDYRVVRELGRGGMGVVYEAEQLSLGRRVALKVLPFAAVLDVRHLQRFQNEVRAAATLDHPHIVSVYSVAEDRGVHFYAMQLIDGPSLADVVSELREPTPDLSHDAHA